MSIRVSYRVNRRKTVGDPKFSNEDSNFASAAIENVSRVFYLFELENPAKMSEKF